MRRDMKALRLVTISAVLSAVLAGVLLLSSSNRATAGESFVLHLECEHGLETDILVPSGSSFAGLVLGSNGVGVLKGVDANGDGVPEFLVPGFEQSDLTACAAFSEVGGEVSFVFVAYVLFTPRGG